MTYARFSQLWDALVTNRPPAENPMPTTDGMTDKTAQALISYGQGDTRALDEVRDYRDSVHRNEKKG